MHFKRYMAFAAPRYYPQGGFGDFIGSFEKEQDAIYAVNQWLMNNTLSGGEGAGDIVDTETGAQSTYVRRFKSNEVTILAED